MTTLSQKSFAGGEIAPSLYARVDTAKYATGLRTCRNMLVMRHGGASNRPGTEFVGEVQDSTKNCRLIPFRFNDEQAYALEFGDNVMRVIRAGAYVKETAKNITGISQASPGVITSVAHGYSTGDEIYLSGIGGMTELNGFNVKVVGINADTYSLTYLDGTAINTTTFTAYTSGGTAERIYTVVIPYDDTDLSGVKYVQSGDLLTLVHPDFPVYEVARTAHASWTVSAKLYEAGIDPPTSVTTTGGTQTRYTVTTVSTANPSVLTTNSNHGYTTDDWIKTSRFKVTTTLLGISQTYLLKDSTYRVVVTGLDTFTLKTLAGTAVRLLTSGTTYSASSGTIKRVKTAAGTIQGVTEYGITSISADTFEESILSQIETTAATPSSGAPLTISWTDVEGAESYNVYRKKNGTWGFIGASVGTSFEDNGIEPDTTETPPVYKNLFDSEDNYPSTVAYYQQRLLLGNTNNNTEKVWGSRTGAFNNFTVSTPLQDDDSVSFTMAGKAVNAVKHLLDVGKLIVLTDAGEWSIEGDSAGILMPGEVNPKQHSYNGAGDLAPIVISGNALYVQARGSIIRDLGFDYQVDGYRGNDLTVFAAHLFDGYTLTDWCYQQTPHSVVWCVRSDGTLLGLTYVREHSVLGWHRHDFDGGTVENVCVVPEGTEDALYLVINRTIDGRSVKYVERMCTRFIDNIEDSIFMDSVLSYDGRNSTATTMTISGGTTWVYSETLTLTASASYFTAADVGNQIHITGDDGTVIRFTINAYTSATVVTGMAHKTVPASMRSDAVTTWTRAVDQVTGLQHLEGLQVSVFADGFVVASPNNESYDVITVTNGAITLDRPYGVIHVGIPYISDIETLDVDRTDGETLADKSKNVSKVTMFLEKSRGIWVGSAPPTDDEDDPLEGLYEVKVRNEETYDEPVELTTGTLDVNIRPEWNSNGRVFIRQVDPVPLSVLAVAPAGLYPIRGGR